MINQDGQTFSLFQWSSRTTETGKQVFFFKLIKVCVMKIFTLSHVMLFKKRPGARCPVVFLLSVVIVVKIDKQKWQKYSNADHYLRAAAWSCEIATILQVFSAGGKHNIPGTDNLGWGSVQVFHQQFFYSTWCNNWAGVMLVMVRVVGVMVKIEVRWRLQWW